jgi:hypothetical protein
MAGRAGYRKTESRFLDVRWRLDNLYTITDKGGHRVPFRMNWAQERLFAEMTHRNVVLKARQLGFSTFIQLFMLDACLFNSNVAAGTIAHTRDDAEAIFKTKAKFPYDHLDEGLKARNPAKQDSARELSFENGSTLRVGTSLRSGTFQYLHVSEFGKIGAKYPDKAKEVVTGSFNTVGPDGLIFVESTAEGQGGEFHDLCQHAQEAQRQQRTLTQLDFKFHFFPWWQEAAYSLRPGVVALTREHSRYFEHLTTQGISLTEGQKAWYAVMLETQKEEMKREYPSTPEEAFEAAVEGAYYGPQMARLDMSGRITRVPHDPAMGVETWWDLGMDDSTTIWFVQRDRSELRCIDYYENSGEGLSHYAGVLRDRRDTRDFVYTEHYAPHDAEVRELSTRKTRTETMKEHGIKWTVVPRHDLRDGIEAVRRSLPLCWFDREHCAQGIRHMRQYRKEWDEERAVYKDHPRHDAASHGADAFRTGVKARGPASARRDLPRPKVAIA